MGKKGDLRKKADAAMCDLAWLAAINCVLKNGGSKEHEEVINNRALNILLNPHKAVTKWGELIFLGFSKFYKNNKKECEAPSDDTGHYLNKSAVVYADAIIQAFLDNTFSVIDPNDKLGSSSVGGKLANLKKKGILKPKYKEVKSANEVRFMAQLRHVITHNSGIIDNDFFNNCKKYEITYDETIWSEEKFEKDFAIGNQVSLPIDEVVVPYLKHAFDFVDDHTNEFINCL